MTDMNDTIKLDPNYALAYFTRGHLSYMLGNNPAALEDFSKAIKLDADDATAYFNRGVAYYVVGGRNADAEADFRKAAELNPKDAYAALWRDLAERRNNGPSHLAEAAKKSRHDGLARARDPPVPRRVQRRTNLRRCLRYRPDRRRRPRPAKPISTAGEFALLKKDKKEAQRLLKLAADNCPPSFIESTAAVAELIPLK